MPRKQADKSIFPDNPSLKCDINFLEYPLWFQQERILSAEHPKTPFEWKTDEGFTYHTSYQITTRFDMFVLWFLLSESQNNDYSSEIITTRYKILQGCHCSTQGTLQYERIEESLERWKHVSLQFDNCFYQDKKKHTLSFRILDSWERKRNAELIVRFSDPWVQNLQNTGYCKWLPLSILFGIRSPLVLRLYELLSKTFYKRSRWQIYAHHLAEKIPMKETHACRIVQKIRNAIEQINQTTDMYIDLKVYQSPDDQKLFIFRKPPF